MKAVFRGLATALVTPFGQEGVSAAMLKRLVRRQLEAGTDALVVCGTTGEAATMTRAEKELALVTVLEAAGGRVPVIMGTGTNSTQAAYKAALEAARLGADAALSVTPYYNKCTQEGLIAHYEAVAQAGLPVIAYHVPGRTGVHMRAETWQRISRIPGICGLKEASGDISLAAAMAAAAPEVPLYAGNDDQILPVLAVGGAGVISTAGNAVPRRVRALIRAWERGDREDALYWQRALLPLHSALFCQVNPIPVKAAMALLGFDCGSPRLPLTPLAPEYLPLLRDALENMPS